MGYVSSLVDHIFYFESLVNVFMKFANLWWDTSFFCKCVTETCVWLLTDWTESSVSLGGSLHAPAGPLSVKPSLRARGRVPRVPERGRLGVLEDLWLASQQCSGKMFVESLWCTWAWKIDACTRWVWPLAKFVFSRVACHLLMPSRIFIAISIGDGYYCYNNNNENNDDNDDDDDYYCCYDYYCYG